MNNKNQITIKDRALDEFNLNRQLNEKEIESKSTVLASKPKVLMIVLTTKCNLNCIMCERNPQREERTIPLEKIKQLFTLFPYLEGISWQGGEVFAVDYFKDLFIKLNDYPNIQQGVITNGLFIDQEWAGILAESRNLNLMYSIDSLAKNTYEKIRKGARFETLLKSVEAIARATKNSKGNIVRSINVVIMRSNYKELDLFPDFCQRFGFNSLVFNHMSGDLLQEDIIVGKDAAAIEYLRDKIPEIEARCLRLNISFECSFRPSLEKENSNNNSVKNYPMPSGKLKCKVPWKKLFIDISRNGEVRPGCLCRFSVGNIFDNKIEDLWNNAMMQEYRSRLVQGNIENFCSDNCLNNLVDRFELEGRL